MAKTSARNNSKGVSALEIARRFGKDRETVRRWIDAGCPYVRKANRSQGVEWLLDPGEVLSWLMTRGRNGNGGHRENGYLEKEEIIARFTLSVASEVCNGLLALLLASPLFGKKRSKEIAAVVMLVEHLIGEKMSSSWEEATGASLKYPAPFRIAAFIGELGGVKGFEKWIATEGAANVARVVEGA